MRRSDMTMKQLDTRQRIIDALGSEWASMNSDAFFEEDYRFEFEAALEHQGEDRRAEVSYHAEEGYLYIDLAMDEEGASLKVYFDGDDELDRVLEVLAEFPDAPVDVEEQVWRIADTGVRVLVYIPDEDEWLELEDDMDIN